jgi:hypothetical protein
MKGGDQSEVKQLVFSSCDSLETKTLRVTGGET